MDYLGNIYLVLIVFVEGLQINNGVVEVDEIIYKLVSVILLKEEFGIDFSFLEDILKEFFNKNLEEGDFNWNGKDKEVIIVYFSSQVFE